MNLLKIGSLQTRIVVFFVLLMLAVQAIGLALVYTVGVSNAKKTISDELVTGERVFNRLLEQSGTQLAQGARILSSDYAFREAVASNDRQTITSALANHGARINAQVMMMVGLDQVVVADTLDNARVGRKFPLPRLIGAAEARGVASAIVLVDGRLYQLVVVPVAVPVPVAWVGSLCTVPSARVVSLTCPAPPRTAAEAPTYSLPAPRGVSK